MNNGFGTRLAWGFTWNGCPSRYPAREGVLPPLGSRCREWFFIDATTGRMIVAIIPPVARHFTLPPAP